MSVQHWNFQHTLFPHPSLCFPTFNTFCLILAKSLPFPNPLTFWLTQAFAPVLVCKPEVQPNTIKKRSKYCLAHSPSPRLRHHHSLRSPFCWTPWCQFLTGSGIFYSQPQFQQELSNSQLPTFPNHWVYRKMLMQKRGVCNADTQQVMRALLSNLGERLSISMSYCSLSETQHPAWIDKQKPALTWADPSRYPSIWSTITPKTIIFLLSV